MNETNLRPLFPRLALLGLILYVTLANDFKLSRLFN